MSPVPGRVFAASASPIISGSMNYPHVVFQRKRREPSTVLLESSLKIIDKLMISRHYATSSMKRICGLITDFGNKDYFIGTLKGVIKQINPDVEIVDISNDIPSYSILSASFVIDKTYCFFPSSTIFLVVVDPGVGTDRRILLVEYANYFFIAPDNGVLSPILQEKEKIVAEIDNKKYFLIDGYSTFEARDKMAPVAAFLSRGIDPREMSSPVSEFILNHDYFPSKTINHIEARVIYIDKFGNVMTNITADFLFEALEESGRSKFKAEFNGREIKEFHETYGHAGADPIMLIGSHQNLEIAINKDSAASLLDAEIGQKIVIKFF